MTDSVNGRVQLLNPDGTIATVWGSPNPGPTILPDPVAVAFDAGGNAYVLDQPPRADRRLRPRDRRCTMRTIGTPGCGPGPAARPLGAGDRRRRHHRRSPTPATSGSRASRAGGSYLGAFPTDERAARHRGDARRQPHLRRRPPPTASRSTTAAGTELDQFGGNGSKLGKLNVARRRSRSTPAGNLWVADRGNNRIQEFGPDGERLLAVGSRGIGDGQFIHPTGVSVDCNGKLTVTDSDNNRVTTFTLAARRSVWPARRCRPRPAPPAPKYPTLPEPLGPQLTVESCARPAC